MDSSGSTSSSEGEELYCNICEDPVILRSKNSSLKAHFEKHLLNPENCGQVLYFSSNMPVQETPKTRGGLIVTQPKRTRTYSGPAGTKSSQTSPRESQFIHGTSPSPRTKPFVHPPDMTRSIPKFAVGNSEPVRKAVPLYNVPLQSRQSYPKMYGQHDNDENKKLIEGVEDKKESWFHESEFRIMSKSSDAECPKCGGLGPFMSGIRSTGNVFCFSSCLLPLLPFVSCCMPQPSLHVRIYCTRCNHELMVFDPKERWLIAK